jgi:hypothetical protein
MTYQFELPFGRGLERRGNRPAAKTQQYTEKVSVWAKDRAARYRAEFENGTRLPAAQFCCQKCKETKPGDAFNRDFSQPSLLQRRCKACESTRKKRRKRHLRECGECGDSFQVSYLSTKRTLCNKCRDRRCKVKTCERHRHFHTKFCLQHKVSNNLDVSLEEAGKIAAKFVGTCKYTGIPFTEDDPPHLDHTIPRAHGGANTADNIEWVIRSFNYFKSASPPQAIEALVAIFLKKRGLSSAA